MIRPAIEPDTPAIRDCARRAFARYIPLIGQTPAPVEADYAANIRDGDVHVATDEDGGLLGFVLFHPSGEAMLLVAVAVLPEAAGQGTGTSLIAFCEDKARRRGFSAVRLYTHEKMTENRALYMRRGYAVIDRRTEDGFPRVFFEKRLRS